MTLSGLAFAAATTSANVLNGRRDGSPDVGRGADQQHRIEVLLGVEGKVLQEGVDRMGVEHEQPVAAVRRGLRDLRGADTAGGARLVLDDDGGAKPLLQPGLHHSRDRIDRAARRKRNDDPRDIAGRGLGEGGAANGAAAAPSTSERRVIVVIAVPSGCWSADRCLLVVTASRSGSAETASGAAPDHQTLGDDIVQRLLALGKRRHDVSDQKDGAGYDLRQVAADRAQEN